jgi:hypothetical protein
LKIFSLFGFKKYKYLSPKIIRYSQNIKRLLKFLLLSNLGYSQIWLDLAVDDHQFGYIKPGKKKDTPDLSGTLCWLEAEANFGL